VSDSGFLTFFRNRTDSAHAVGNHFGREYAGTLPGPYSAGRSSHPSRGLIARCAQDRRCGAVRGVRVFTRVGLFRHLPSGVHAARSSRRRAPPGSVFCPSSPWIERASRPSSGVLWGGGQENLFNSRTCGLQCRVTTGASSLGLFYVVQLPPGRIPSGCVVEFVHELRTCAVMRYLGHLAESTFSF
jgi:hypothetical protein